MYLFAKKYLVLTSIALDGGNAKTGECAFSSLSPGTYVNGDVIVGDAENDGVDTCPDITSSGNNLLENYQMDPIVFQCLDSDLDGLME